MKQIYDAEDFKNIINSQGVSLASSVKITKDGIKYTLTVSKDQLELMFKRTGLLVRSIELSKDSIIVDLDPLNEFVRPKQ